MKQAFLRFYEELNDFLPPEKTKERFEHHFTGTPSVKDMIESLGVPHTEVDLILVNGKSVDFSYIVDDKDEISVYPVFESFDISEVQHLRPAPLREPKFIADVHLGKLARYMRMIGLDTVYRNNFSDNEIITISLEERRTIVTRNRNILKRNEVTHGIWIRNENTTSQLREIIERFHLDNHFREFSRCLECNESLNRIEKEDILALIPSKVSEWHNNFYICPVCNKVYWQGTHYKKMMQIIKELKKEL